MTDAHFWDYYVSVDSQYYSLMDVFRVIQKLSQNSSESLSFDALHGIITKMVRLTRGVKSLYLRENPHMVTRELYEKSIEDAICG